MGYHPFATANGSWQYSFLIIILVVIILTLAHTMNGGPVSWGQRSDSLFIQYANINNPFEDIPFFAQLAGQRRL